MDERWTTPHGQMDRIGFCPFVHGGLSISRPWLLVHVVHVHFRIDMKFYVVLL